MRRPFKNLERWLGQFSDQDQDTAKKLVDAIEFVTPTDFSREMKQAILKLQENLGGPLALYAVRESKESYFPRRRDRRPASVAAKNDIGSEGIVAQMIRELAVPRTLLSHPTISTLRRQKIRNVVLVDDNIGSGSRVTGFLESFYRDRSIRSICSTRSPSFWVLVYSGSQAGIDLIHNGSATTKSQLRKRDPDNIHIRHYPRKYPKNVRVVTVMNPMRPLSGELQDLCRKYGRKWGVRSDYFLGYRKAGALTVFEHGCPNTVPGILWWPSLKDGMISLFPNRKVTIPPESLPDSGPPWRVEEPTTIAVLKSLRDGIRHVNHISRATGLPNPVIKSVLTSLRDSGTIDHRRCVTHAAPYETMNHQDVHPGARYIPRQLRGTSDED